MTSRRKPSRGPGAKPTAGDVDERFAPVIAAFSGEGRVTLGRMMGSVGLRVNGKIFAMVSRGKLVVKLPGERVTALVGSGLGRHFDPRRNGRLMKEWVQLEGTEPSWTELATEAFQFVLTGRTGAPGRHHGG